MFEAGLKVKYLDYLGGERIGEIIEVMPVSAELSANGIFYLLIKDMDDDFNHEVYMDPRTGNVIKYADVRLSTDCIPIIEGG